MNTRLVFIFLVAVLAGINLYGQSTDIPILVRVAPGLNIPIGEDGNLYSVSGGVAVSGHYRLPFLRLLTIGAELGYSRPGLAPVALHPGSLSFVSGAAVAGIDFEVLPRFSIELAGHGGYFYGFFNDDASASGSNPYLGASFGVSYQVLPAIDIGIGVSYRNFVGLYNDFQLALATTYRFGGQGSSTRQAPVQRQPDARPEPLKQAIENLPQKDGIGLAITQVRFDEIFPVFFKYYDKHPIGRAVLHNFEKVPVENIRVNFLVKQYMDNPKPSPAPPVLQPGEEKEIEVYGLFTNAVLDISEGTVVSALLSVEYTKDGQRQSNEHVQTLRINNRNAVTWDDDRKASAFVTAKDPAVLKFSKNVVGWISSETSRTVNKNLQLAVALHEALDLYGISYVVDPTTPYIEYSENTSAIDYLQFPKQTLEFLAGDCDDLSILYSALLEAVGVETAFVTTPGHIFVAFDLGIPPDSARKEFFSPDDLIFRDEKSWLPVEITRRREGFLKAWQTGAKEWRENTKRNQAAIIPMHDAWTLYEPVGFPGTPNISMPDRTRVVAAFSKALEAFVTHEINSQESKLIAEIKQSPNNVSALNKLGVLYARYGLESKAEANFTLVLQKRESLPALINMGNLEYLREEYAAAQRFYRRAERLSPDNPLVLLCLARVDHSLENYATSWAAYSKLKEVDPQLARRFAYLDLRGEEAARAADVASVGEEVVWAEE